MTCPWEKNGTSRRECWRVTLEMVEMIEKAVMRQAEERTAADHEEEGLRS